MAEAYFPSIVNQRKGFNPTKPEKYVGQEITIEEASVLSFDVTGGVGGAKKAGNVKPTRRKFVCVKCGMSAQAKQSAKLKCGECDEVML